MWHLAQKVLAVSSKQTDRCNEMINPANLLFVMHSDVCATGRPEMIFFYCQQRYYRPGIKFIAGKINVVCRCVLSTRHLSDLHRTLGSDFRTMARNLLNYLQNVTAPLSDFLSITQESIKVLIKFASFYFLSILIYILDRRKINCLSKSKKVHPISRLFRVVLGGFVTFCYGTDLILYARLFLTAFQSACVWQFY